MTIPAAISLDRAQHGSIRDRQHALTALYSSLVGPEAPLAEEAPVRRSLNVVEGNLDILARASNARNGWKFKQLMAGDWQGLGYPSESDADLALCEFLVYWGAESDDEVDRLFRQSALCDEKWERDDYREVTIAKAREMALASRHKGREPERIINVYDSKRRSGIRLLTVADLLALPKLDWLVADILPREGISVLAGEWATYKTFVMLDIALSVAAGTNWLGHPVAAGPVVYCCAEGKSGFVQRLKAWSTDRKQPLPSSFRIVADAVNLMNSDSVDDLLAEIEKLPEPPVLVVFDTLARNMVGGDENSAGDIGLVIAAAGELGKRGCHVVFVHHLNKQGGLRGSSALPGALDVLIEVRRVGDHVTLKCRKQKDAVEFDAITLAPRIIDLADGGSSLVLDAASPRVINHGSSDAGDKMRAVLVAGAPEGLTSGEWEERCRQAGIPKSTFNTNKKKLIERGLVVSDGAPGLRGARFRSISSASSQ